MAIKCEVKSFTREDKITFPCLRRSKQFGAVVLFTGMEDGILICRGQSAFVIGHYSNGWEAVTNTNVWEKCSVTLTSED